MSYKWPDKHPDTTNNYSVDWSRLLNTGETINSVKWFIINPVDGSINEVTSSNPVERLQPLYPTGLTNTDTVATIRLSSGKVNLKYKLQCTITTSPDDRTLTEEMFLRVREGA